MYEPSGVEVFFQVIGVITILAFSAWTGISNIQANLNDQSPNRLDDLERRVDDLENDDEEDEEEMK